MPLGFHHMSQLQDPVEIVYPLLPILSLGCECCQRLLSTPYRELSWAALDILDSIFLVPEFGHWTIVACRAKTGLLEDPTVGYRKGGVLLWEAPQVDLEKFNRWRLKPLTFRYKQRMIKTSFTIAVLRQGLGVVCWEERMARTIPSISGIASAHAGGGLPEATVTQWSRSQKFYGALKCLSIFFSFWKHKNLFTVKGGCLIRK